MSTSSGKRETTFTVSLLSGGVAGTTVDVALFPLDTIKTRLQSPQGFLKAGGFNGVYKGLSAAAAGSAPGASLFFATYEMGKQFLNANFGDRLPQPMIHMTAAAFGEVTACLVRVPTEVVKQRMQAGMHSKFLDAVSHIVKKEGPFGLYSGFSITIMREIPFSFIQFPLYEYMKVLVERFTGRQTQSYEAALCGSVSGGFAAAVTTPLDVLKTRLMLGADREGRPYKGIVDTLFRVLAEGDHNNNNNISTVVSTDSAAAASATPRSAPSPSSPSPSSSSISSMRSLKPLFAGIQPRVMWISIGGFVFFGAYEHAKSFLLNVL